VERWTQARMNDLAAEERANVGLSPFEPLDVHRLAEEYGVAIYCLAELDDDQAHDAVAYFSQDGWRRWSAALIPIGSRRVIIENDSHPLVRRRSSIGHELSHHLLEHPFVEMLLTDLGCRRFDAKLEGQATYLSGQLLVPEQAALKAAFDAWTNEQVADHFGVSTQFAQMRMKGTRVLAQRALRKQAAARRS
jgi:Zn-dependent peptidase ImmA (M78 family)